MRYVVEYVDDKNIKHWITVDSFSDVKFLMKRFDNKITILSSFKI